MFSVNQPLGWRNHHVCRGWMWGCSFSSTWVWFYWKRTCALPRYFWSIKGKIRNYDISKQPHFMYKTIIMSKHQVQPTKIEKISLSSNITNMLKRQCPTTHKESIMPPSRSLSHCLKSGCQCCKKNINLNMKSMVCSKNTRSITGHRRIH